MALRITIIILLLCSPVMAQFQQDCEQESATAVSTINCTINGVTAGNKLVACFRWRDTGTLPTFSSISNTGADSWVQVETQQTSGAGTDALRVYYVDSASSGNQTITATVSEDWVNASLWVGELQAGSLDVSSADVGASGTAVNPGALTTTGASAVIVSCGGSIGARTWTAESSPAYTLQSSTGSVRHGAQTIDDAGAAGSKSTTLTISSSNAWLAIAAAFNSSSCADHLAFDSTYTQLGTWYEDRTTSEIRVRIENSSNGLCSENTDTIVVAKGDTGAGAIGGTTSKAAVAGIATFTDLTWDTAEAMTLDWTSGAITAIDEQATTVQDVPAGNYVDAEDNCPPVAGGLCFAPTDLDIRVDFQMVDWTPASDTAIHCQEDSWCVYITTEGYFGIWWTTNGVDSNTCEVTTAPTSPTRLSGRWVLDTDAGATDKECLAYTKTDQTITNNVGWTQLGSANNSAGTTSVNNSTQLISIGKDHEGTYADYTAGSTIYQVAIMDGIAGSNIADPDFRSASCDPNCTDSLGNVWTLNGTPTWSLGASSSVIMRKKDLIRRSFP